MSFAAARAAAPLAIWSETLSRYTGKSVGLNGKKALRLEGLPFDITLKPLAYNGYQMDIVHSEEPGRATEAGCAAAFAIVVKALEGRFGPLGPMKPLSKAEADGLPIGFQMLSLYGEAQPVEAGRKSRAQVFHPEGTGTKLWLSGRRQEGLSLLVGARYLDRTSPLWPSTCVLTARLVALPPRPAFEWVDLARLPSPPIPPAPARRRSFAGLPSLPPQAAGVDVVCEVDREWGGVSRCKATEGTAEALARPAERQGDMLKLEPSALDPDSDIPLRLRLTLLIDPADAKPFVPPAGVTPLKATDVVWAQQPTRLELERSYPDRALRMGANGSVAVLCRIEADGALSIQDVTVKSREGVEGSFEEWGETIARGYRASPTLADGQPSTGRWVSLSYALTAAD